MASEFRTARANDLDDQAAGVVRGFVDGLGSLTDDQAAVIRRSLPPVAAHTDQTDDVDVRDTDAA